MKNRQFLMLLISVAASFLLSGCYVAAHGPHGRAAVSSVPPPVAKSGPPPHAKAYGHRAKYRYHYYPDAYVYFDTGRGVYFYLEGRRWVMSAALPSRLHVSLDGRVSLELDVDQPYLEHDDHRKKYPGKKGKKKKQKQKGKYKKYKDKEMDD
jgi:hypothetical protein